MLEALGDIWRIASTSAGKPRIVVTTNGFVKRNGECVMGRGIALQAKQRFPELPATLGSLIATYGNRVFRLPHDLYSFPTKHNWWENADPELIRQSANQLAIACAKEVGPILMPRPGCGNGNLDWADIHPIVEPYLDNRFVAVSYR